MTDAEQYTPTQARVCIDFCNAAIKRPRPDGSFMTMEEADAAFDRMLAKVRAEAVAQDRQRIRSTVGAFSENGVWIFDSAIETLNRADEIEKGAE